MFSRDDHPCNPPIATRKGQHVYRSFGFPGAEDLGNMFQFKRDFHDDVCRGRDVVCVWTLHPALQAFEAWLARHKDRIRRD